MKNAIGLHAAILLLLSCTEEPISQQNPVTTLAVYNTSNSALPNDQVQAIVSSNNTTWIGTANGLASFDGITWNTFDTLNTSLSSQFFTALEADASGRIWVGTDKGLGFYDGFEWQNVAEMKSEFITKLLYDASADVLWVGSEKGLSKFDGSRWERYDDPNSSLLDFYVSSLAVDSKGLLWMGSFEHHSFVGRLFTFDGSKWTGVRLDEKGLPSSFPDALAIDRQDVVWLGVKGTMGGMLVKIQDDQWEIFNRPDAGCFQGGGINAIAISGNVKLIASGTGLVSYQGNSWNCFTTDNSALPDNFVSSISVDEQGRQWFGTISGGLLYIGPGGKPAH